MTSRPTNPSPPCPFDLGAVVPEGLLATLSTLELGALARLITHAWRALPPHAACSLDGADAVLARLAGLTPEEWRAARPALMPVFSPIEGDRLLCPALAEIHARADRARSQRALAGRASAAARASPEEDQARQRPFNGRSTDAQRPLPSAPTTDPRAPAPLTAQGRAQIQSAQRSDPSRVPSDGAASGVSGGTDVLATLGRRAEAMTDGRLALWHRTVSRAMLAEAIGRWSRDGRTDLPASKIAELADGRWSSPARVQAAIERADDLIRAGGKDTRPVAVLIHALGLVRKGKPRPIAIPLVLQARWDRLEDEQRRELAPVGARLAREAQTQDQADETRRRLRAQLEQRPAAGGGA